MPKEVSLIAPGGSPMDLSPLTGMRDQVRDVIRQNIKQMLVDALYDKVGHAYAVAAGKVHFRDAFMKGMGAFFDGNRGQADYLADVCYQFLETQWRLKYAGTSPGQFLDAVHIPSPLSAKEQEREIEDAWEVQIESSQEAMEKHYVGSARTRRGRDAFSSFWHREQKS